MLVINCRGQHSAGLTTCLSTDSKTYTLLISVYNDADTAYDYNRVIGIAQLKGFSCAKKEQDLTVACHQNEKKPMQVNPPIGMIKLNILYYQE